MQISRRLLLIAGMASLLGCTAPTPDPAGLAPGQTATLFNGRDLTGWQALRGDYYDSAGPIAARDGGIVLGAGQDLTGVRWTGSVLRDNYAISLRAKRVEGSDFFCGLTFPVGKQCVTLILGGWGGSIVGLSNVDDRAAVDNQTTSSVQFEQNRWYDVEVRVAAGRIRVWLDDDEPVIDLACQGHHFEVWPEQEQARPLGVTTYATTGAIDGFLVHRLDEAPAP